jgi:hypothetical protein
MLAVQIGSVTYPIFELTVTRIDVGAAVCMLVTLVR